jgi:hypothetical protein
MREDAIISDERAWLTYHTICYRDELTLAMGKVFERMGGGTDFKYRAWGHAVDILEGRDKDGVVAGQEA